jgi:OOP family OmpA-OmpF porin
MILQKRITARGTNTKVLFLLLLLAGILASAKAQTGSYDFHGDHHPVNQSKTALHRINHSDDINLEAKAVPLNTFINSPYDDLKPALTPCGKRLYFSRHIHPGNTFGEADMEDIWFSDFDETTNTWSHPALMTGHLNNAGPNAINNVSLTGDTIILENQYKKNGKMRAGLSYSVNIHGKWSFPTTIHIKNDYNISEQANSFVSLKNGIIIRAIQRIETVGLRDLYVSFWNGHEATEPINMGNVINSEFEEASPFLSSDNKTLYFASKGHSGHGGFDIYRTERLDDTWTNWSPPENLGPAVNGPMDDEFFSVTHCGNYAIFSKQVNVHNTDLFRIPIAELFNTEKPQQKIIENKSTLTAFASL